MQQEVTETTADFFYEMLTGNYCGDQALKPYNPILQAFCKSHEATTKHDFIKLLRSVADKLEITEQKF